MEIYDLGYKNIIEFLDLLYSWYFLFKIIGIFNKQFDYKCSFFFLVGNLFLKNFGNFYFVK